MRLFDGHTHSGNSYDAEHDVIFMAEKAAAMGLWGFAVTDHCEIERYREDRLDRVIYQSVFDAKLAASIFEGRIKIISGVELGQPVVSFSDAEKILKIGGIDYVIGSLHSIKGKEDFYFWDFEKEKDQIDHALTCYFDQMLEMVQWGRFDTLAHITYPVRYISGDYHIPVDLQKYSGQIDEIFRLLIEKEIALELNTSGFRQAIGDSLPSRALLERYYKMGGRLLTIGSDSHSAFDMGKGVKEGIELAKSVGFSAYYYYEKRKPMEISIE